MAQMIFNTLVENTDIKWVMIDLAIVRTHQHATGAKKWKKVFETLSQDADNKYMIIDSTIVRAHQHAAGAKKGHKL